MNPANVSPPRPSTLHPNRSSLTPPQTWRWRSFVPVLSVVTMGAVSVLGGCTAHPTSSATAPISSSVATNPHSPEVAGTVVAPLTTPVAVLGSGDIASLVERLKPAVVNITTTRQLVRGEGGLPFPGHPSFGGSDGPARQANSLGTGFIVDPSGYVVTNAHVIQGADDIRVRLADEREFPAKLVGRDPKLDLALLQIQGASALTAVSLGDSDGLRVGDWVLAIGNPYGLGHTVTLGITSAKDRSINAGPYDAFIQTDASINPGNSGGPLFNLKGEVVGIPTAIRAGAQGIGFAVPVNALKDVLSQLRDHGSVSRGKLGVRIQRVSDELATGLGLDRPRGALVSSMESGGSASRAGVQAGDVILKVNGADVPHSDDLPRMVARNQPGSKVKLTVFRAAKSVDLEATLDLLADEDEDEPTSPRTKPPTAQPQGGKVGLEVDDAPGGGARIRGVSGRSVAAGQLFAGDVVLEVDRVPVKTATDLVKKFEAGKPGTVLLLKVKRGEDQRFVGVKVP